MPETTEPATPATEVVEADPKPETDQVKRAATDAAEIEKWKSLSRQHEARAKSNADAATKLTEIEDAQKSEVDKAADKIKRAEARATEIAAELVRLKVAVRHGLSEDQAARLIGTTEEELDADAKVLLKLLAPPVVEVSEEGDPAPVVAVTPKPKLKSGSVSKPLNDDKLLADLKRKVGVA